MATTVQLTQPRDETRESSSAALAALARANLRFWPTVAPSVGRELARWDRPAREIPDAALRELALHKLSNESFNAEVAATLATLTPRPMRARTVRAIVALEVLFDYLDGRTELPAEDPLEEGERLFTPFTQAVRPHTVRAQVTTSLPADSAHTDARYIRSLSERVRENLLMLPAAAAVGPVAYAAARRCAQAQTRIHAAGTLGQEALEQWAREQALGSGLEWREYLAGGASSVLAVHALIAIAGREGTTREEAERIDAAYLAIAGVITMLDSLVDHSADSARGESGFIQLFHTRDELTKCLRELTREALTRIRLAPYSAHHIMTFAGVVAYYTSHPGAQERHARPIVAMVRRELAPTIWPTLAVMRMWRSAKTVRTLAYRGVSCF
jgi:tetraprenyl-beta-curcumene synthase